MLCVSLQNSGDHHFFARKFEAIVNQDVIKTLDEYLYGGYDPSTPGLTSYWENIYHIDDDITTTSSAHYTVYQSFLRKSQGLVRKLENGNQSALACPLLKSPTVKELFVYYKDNQFKGYVMRYEESGDGRGFMYEALLAPSRYRTRYDTNIDADKRIIDIQVSYMWYYTVLHGVTWCYTITCYTTIVLCNCDIVLHKGSIPATCCIA